MCSLSHLVGEASHRIVFLGMFFFSPCVFVTGSSSIHPVSVVVSFYILIVFPVNSQHGSMRFSSIFLIKLRWSKEDLNGRRIRKTLRLLLLLTPSKIFLPYPPICRVIAVTRARIILGFLHMRFSSPRFSPLLVFDYFFEHVFNNVYLSYPFSFLFFSLFIFVPCRWIFPLFVSFCSFLLLLLLLFPLPPHFSSV